MTLVSVKYPHEETAEEFLELSSAQRLNILLKLLEKKSKISTIAKELDATVPEVFRNFERLSKRGFVAKDSEGEYHITPYGKIWCSQIPTIDFLSRNRKYFADHEFGNTPTKFIQRIGSLSTGKHVKGFVKVLDLWKEIYEKADEYIYNILFEVAYTSDLVDPLVAKLNKKVKVNSIFSKSAIMPKEREEVIKKMELKKFVDEGLIERKMLDHVGTAVILNEKEACVMFPRLDGEPDLSELFYGDDPLFHEWCLDFFRYSWHLAEPFQESKFKENRKT